MKIIFIFIAFVWLFTSCHKDPYYESETDEHFVILKEEITSLTNVPVQFYWIRGRIDSLEYATSCLSTEVKFERPYLIANGIRFHVYRWQTSQNIFDNKDRTISRMELRFYPN